MENLIKVSIAKLGTSIQSVEIPTGSNVMTALRKAGYNLDGVVSVKRNGIVVNLDTLVDNEDILLVSMEKIKGGTDAAEEASVLKLSFAVVKESENGNNQMLFTNDMSTFEIVKQVLLNAGLSLNEFKELRNSNNEIVTFEDKLVDGESYRIVVCGTPDCWASEEDDNY